MKNVNKACLAVVFSIGLVLPAFGQEGDASSPSTNAASSDTNFEVVTPSSSNSGPQSERIMSQSGDVQEFTVNRAYTIQPGDTLSDICNVLLDNAWYWPKLWSLNQYIKNPHFIYPGNRLVFTPGTDSTYPNLELVQDGQPELEIDEMMEAPRVKEQAPAPLFEDPFENTIIESSMAQGTGMTIRLKNIHTLTSTGNKPVGKVTHSIEPKKLLVFGDSVYIEFYRSDYRDNVKVGDKFYTVENVETVHNRGKSKRKIGTLVRKKAVLEIVAILQNPRRSSKKIYEAKIIDSEYSVDRGDEIIEYQSDVKSLVPHYTEEIIDGYLVAADNQQYLIENNDFVYLNLGTNQGLTEGLQLYVVRRGDGYIDDGQKDLPDVPVARVMVVEAWDNTAAAYVVTLKTPLEVGDRVTTQIER